MFKHDITFEDFNGEERTETFYFNLSKVELLRLESEHKGGFENYVNAIINSKDNKEAMEAFEQIIKMSVGRKSLDGSRFVKSDEIRSEFLESNAYDEFMVELIQNPDLPAQFVNSIVPPVKNNGPQAK